MVLIAAKDRQTGIDNGIISESAMTEEEEKQ
jgi:hypothetical protein